MNYALIILIPIISALIGWFTNYFAIWSLFRPVKPINVLGFQYQGVLPKRQKMLSEKLAVVVEKYLFSHDDIVKLLAKKENLEKIKKELVPLIEERFMRKIPSLLRGIAEPFVKTFLEKEIDDLLKEINKGLAKHIIEVVDIKKIVYDKLVGYNPEKLESVIRDVSNKELKHIEYLGGVIGLVIGLVQVVMITLL